MVLAEHSKTCTAAERALLDMITCWPGVPALVTMNADGSFAVSTPDVEQEGSTSLRQQFGLAPEKRSEEELQAAEVEQRLCDISVANLRLNEAGLPHLGEGGQPLDAIFHALNEAEQLHRSGAVFLSSEATLRPTPILFIGLNPGGDDALVTSTILDNLRSCRSGKSAWEEDWNGRPGEATLQRRFKQVASFIGVDPLSIPATNVVFTRSRDVAGHVAWNEDRRAATTVHRILADTVRPEKLWFMGNPQLAGDLLTLKDVKWRRAGHARWSIGHGTAVYAGCEVTFCHTPHLSVWDPTGKDDELRFAFGLLD